MARQHPKPTSFIRRVNEHGLGPKMKDHQWTRGPLNLAFTELAEIYCRRFEETNNGLAAKLKTSPQTCSQWKSGSAGRRPTFKALIWLCNATNHQLVVDGNGVHVRRCRKPNQPSPE